MNTIAKNRNLFAALAAVAIVGAAAGAHANEVTAQAPAVTVRYADLNLATHAGVNRLYDRIRHAAEQVCGDTEERQLERAAAVKACVAHAVEGGVQAVGNPMLTQAFDADLGIAKPIRTAALR